MGRRYSEKRKTTNQFKNELKGRIQNSLSGFLRVCLVGLLILFQFVIILMLPYLLNSFSVYFYVVVEVLSIVVMIGLMNDKRSQSYKLAWFSIVLVLPISGHILFALWGNTTRKKKIERRIVSKINYGNQFLKTDQKLLKDYVKKYPNQGRLSKFMSYEKFPLFKNNALDYYPMGEEVFEAIFKDIEKAKKFILIDFYIIADGAIWDKFHTILLKKMEEGVEVKFIFDDFGAAIRTSKDFKKNLILEGFKVRVFNPIHRYTDKLYMNYRSHQKIIVVDGNIGYTGGFNIADEYANLIDRFGIWKDAGIRVEGDAVWGLTVIFHQMWGASSLDQYIDYAAYKPTKKFVENDVYCHVISDGPANNPNNPIESIYKQMIVYADKYLYIMTPYLIIEDFMRETLIEAVKRGVDVRIITPFIPDKKNVKWLTNYNYGGLLRHGIRIFEYKPGFMHAKVIMNEFSAIVGTINMDYRSFYLHYENGIWMSHKDIVNKIRLDFFRTIGVSKEITYEEWKNRPWTIKVLQQGLNLFSTLM